MRIVVVGTSGAGKTTMAAALAKALAMPHVELDALQWDSNWRGLTQHDPHEFVRRVAAATSDDRWVSDGNYGLVRDLIWTRATHLVWLDYERPVIMARVIRRSLVRIACRTELWAGNREVWHRIFRPSHPIIWAWSTWRRRRSEIEALLAQPDYAHLTVLRLRRPREAASVIPRLRRDLRIPPEPAAASTGAGGATRWSRRP